MRLLAFAALALLPASTAAAGIAVPHGLAIEHVATVTGARQLAALPNGDLIVGTSGDRIAIVPQAQAAHAGAPRTFATIDDAPAAGVAYSAAQRAIYVATQHGIYRIPYVTGDRHARATPVKIASVRTGPVAPNSDGDVHRTTSVALSTNGKTLYASVGSSCNACAEVDPTRATLQQMSASGAHMTLRAKRIRNAIAVAADPANGHLWAGGAGQDDLPAGHPYEFLDDVSAQHGIPDYGWPQCEEQRVAYVAGATCTNVAVPIVEFPAYSTIMAVAFYPARREGAHYLAAYAGGIFVALHGSWHKERGCNVKPSVAFVRMRDDRPASPVDWHSPTKQWQTFASGFQPACGSQSRIGRPAGVAVGSDGSLFISDDLRGAIYRVRSSARE
jgi:glucose/arabinose dehydrogenase